MSTLQQGQVPPSAQKHSRPLSVDVFLRLKTVGGWCQTRHKHLLVALRENWQECLKAYQDLKAGHLESLNRE